MSWLYQQVHLFLFKRENTKLCAHPYWALFLEADQAQCSPEEKETRAAWRLSSYRFQGIWRCSALVIANRPRPEYFKVPQPISARTPCSWGNCKKREQGTMKLQMNALSGRRLIRDFYKTLQQWITNWYCASLHDLMISLPEKVESAVID